MFKQYINGKCVEGKGKTSAVYNPATDEVVGEVSCANAEQATEALLAAEKAFETWSKTPVNERANWMYKFRDECVKERDKLVELISMESGRTYPFACADVDWWIISLGYYADEAKRINGEVLPGPNTDTHYILAKQPIGVTVGHVAWNYPLGNASVKACPAIASGCTCVIKPSSETPLATLYLGEIAERIGFPKGVLNIVSGPANEVAKTLNESTIPRMISLIGSYETGLKLLQQSVTSVKKYSLELGGNAPVVVMPDVDIDEVADSIIAKKIGFAGQTCVNYNRIYIQRSIYPQLCETIEKKLANVKLGKWKDEGQIMGPVINKKERDRLLGMIEDAVKSGAKLTYGGKVSEGAGAFMEPALLVDVTDDMRVSKEEIFGPIIPLQPFDTLEEAIAKSNNTIYGLSAYFYGHNTKEVNQFLQNVVAGEIFVNGAGGNEFTPHAGAKQSGIGCDKSKWSLEEYYGFKLMSIKA